MNSKTLLKALNYMLLESECAWENWIQRCPMCAYTKRTPLLGSNFSETQPLIFRSIPLQTPNASANL